MLKLQQIHIKRYRSISDLVIQIDTSNNFITICGENNAGKTNTLRALNLFFNPDKYEPSKDIPHHKRASGGGTVSPDITVELLSDDGYIYTLQRSFGLESLEKTEGFKLRVGGKRKDRIQLNEKEIKEFLCKTILFYIESINISFPNLINSLINDLYDIEYEKARFTGLKSELKEAFDKYTKGILEILHLLSEEISPLFKEYKENWGIGFNLNSDVKKFRDLITDEIVFYINDNSNKNIEGKGSGLQRLGYILLHSRIIEKIKSKSVFLLIDEPDAYLHQKFQKKLLSQLLEITSNAQVFITTHSHTFIDSYTLNNVFLLDLDIEEKEYTRNKGVTYHALNTRVVDLDQIDGAKKIRSYLGIEELDYEILDKYNILVEGETDKKYLEELSKFFHFSPPRIISANGADNIPKHLKFYDSYYQHRARPSILVLLDNDSKGREVFNQVAKDVNKLPGLDLHVECVPNFLGETSLADIKSGKKVTTDNQIEDFIYPELLCELVNRLLKKKSLTAIDSAKLCRNIQKPSFKGGGILKLVEHNKNEKNPQNGQDLVFDSSSYASEQVKSGLAGLLLIQGDRKLVQIIQTGDTKYPKVREFLERITNAHNFVTTQLPQTN